MGNILHQDPQFVVRGAAIIAGFPVTTSTSTVNRFCSSGLLAVQSIANQISTGCIDVGLAVGAESPSTCVNSGAPLGYPRIWKHDIAKEITIPILRTSENVAQEYGIGRDAQDEYAASSFRKAEICQKAGWAAVDEICPVTTQWIDPKTGEKKAVTAEFDDGIRYGTTKEGLSKLSAKYAHGTVTAGNASQEADGAAALLLMRRDVAMRLGQPILAKFVASTVVGLEPGVMGCGPSLAIPKLLGRAGLRKEDVDIYEINESFASMVSRSTRSMLTRTLTSFAGCVLC